MKVKTSQRSRSTAPKIAERLIPSVIQADALPPEAFLEEAKKEAKRSLLMDHIQTIKALREQKRFTFRGIAKWLGERGIETDHSAVYRTYLAAIPEEKRDPCTDWSDVDEPGFGDESASIKKGIK